MTTRPTLSPAEAYEDYFAPAIFEPLADVVVGKHPPSPGGRVLDVACGTGVVARRAAAHVGPGGSVVGVDLNPAMLEVARAHPVPGAGRLEWRAGDGVPEDLPDGSFDAVYCQQGLQFFDDRERGARGMHRVLGDGGRAVIAVWRGLAEHPLYEALADAEAPALAELGVPVTRDDHGKPFSLGDPDELRDLLTGAGFREVEVVRRSITARFATADRFVARTEHAYAAVVPAFTEDPTAFDAYVERIARETRPVVERFRDGDEIVVPMHANLALACR